MFSLANTHPAAGVADFWSAMVGGIFSGSRSKQWICNGVRSGPAFRFAESSFRRDAGPVGGRMTGTYRYVLHEDMDAYERLGWLCCAHIRADRFLMRWPCTCKCVEPA